MKGTFRPNHPEKYLGDPTQIFFRSSWELSYMMRLDSDPCIIRWGSEEIIIPYRSPKDNRIHRYFPDIILTDKNKKTSLIEIKPERQTKPPKKRKGKKYIAELQTYFINQAKFKAATDFAAKRGWTFTILTEKELF
jgi:hypothetical protein